MSVTADERETIATTSDGADEVNIYTGQRSVISRMRRDKRFTEVKSLTDHGTEFVTFTIPASNWNPVTGAKRTRTMTPAAKEALAKTHAVSKSFDYDPAAVRKWAQEQGISVGSRGRFSGELLAAYRDAQAKPKRTRKSPTKK